MRTLKEAPLSISEIQAAVGTQEISSLPVRELCRLLRGHVGHVKSLKRPELVKELKALLKTEGENAEYRTALAVNSAAGRKREELVSELLTLGPSEVLAILQERGYSAGTRLTYLTRLRKAGYGQSGELARLMRSDVTEKSCQYASTLDTRIKSMWASEDVGPFLQEIYQRAGYLLVSPSVSDPRDLLMAIMLVTGRRMTEVCQMSYRQSPQDFTKYEWTGKAKGRGERGERANYDGRWFWDNSFCHPAMFAAALRKVQAEFGPLTDNLRQSALSKILNERYAAEWPAAPESPEPFTVKFLRKIYAGVAVTADPCFMPNLPPNWTKYSTEARRAYLMGHSENDNTTQLAYKIFEPSKSLSDVALLSLKLGMGLGAK